MKAWLVTWEWGSDSTAVVDKIAGILNPRWSSRRVVGVIEFLYAHETSTLGELAHYAKRPSNNPYRSHVDFSNRIDCGANPMLHAEIVSDLKIETDQETWIETVSWTGQDVYRPSEARPVLFRKGRRHSFTRFITGSLSSDCRWDHLQARFKKGFDDRDT